MTFQWDAFFRYLWPPTAFQDPLIRDGLVITVILAIASQLLGVILGVVGALGQMSRSRAVRWLAGSYVLYFRGTPLLVQLVLLYYGLSAIGLYRFPDLYFGPFMFPGVMQAAILGLGLNEGAYFTEIVRAGILSIHAGQMQSARAIGMTFPQAMRWIILPQAAKVIVPPLGNEFNNTIKATTLVVIIGGGGLFSAYEQVNARLFLPFELYLAVSFYYLALAGLWGVVQARLEATFGEPKAAAAIPRAGVFQRLLGAGGRR
jgi:polar amino acid transport system permease protein